MEMVKFIEHISHPGFGYIDPYMDEDDPLIHRDVGEMLTERLNELAGDYHRVLDQYIEVVRWYESRDRTEFGWAKLDKIMENQDD